MRRCTPPKNIKGTKQGGGGVSVLVTFPVADRNSLQREGRKGLLGLTAEGFSSFQQRGLGGRSWRQLVTSAVRGEEGWMLVQKPP